MPQLAVPDAEVILESRKYKYSRARELLLDAILAGEFAADSVLPAEAVLCRQLGIGRNTLRAALHELEDAGVIIKQHGRCSRINFEALRQKRTPLRRIAWLDTSPIANTNQIYFDIFRAVSEETAARGVRLDYISLSISAMAENFFERQLDYHGLILGEITPGFESYLGEITHPNSICVDCPRKGIAHCVKTDNYLGGRLAARTLVRSGHRRPALLGFDRTICEYLPFEERCRGFADELAESGVPLPPERILMLSADDKAHFPAFLEANLGRLNECDALFVIADMFAVEALYALPKLGLRIPGRLSLIGFDGLTLSRFVSPALTTIRQPVREIGRKALEIVLNPAESYAYPGSIPIPPTLIPGGTVRMTVPPERPIR